MWKVLLIITSFLCVGTAWVTQMPEHNCTDYFTYGIQKGTDYIGLFTADQAGLESLSWSIEFMWYDNSKELVGDIKMYPDENEAWNNLRSGFRSMVFVRFTNITTELPLLTLLKLNQKILCSNPKYVGSYGSKTLLLNYATIATIPEIPNTYKKTVAKLPVIPSKVKVEWRD